MYKLRFTPEFVRDFEKIKDDVIEASRSEDIADRYLRDFMTKIKGKRGFPHSGIPLYYGDLFTGFYYVHFKAYNAFYTIKGEYIELVRALLSKSDYMKVLFGEYQDVEQEDDRGQDLYVNDPDGTDGE